ncbi:response regulator [Paucibacter sp. R3-3]|uniref:Response regulator n=1 Tax=Roseateles agri TaxID=3098619 RepID=A0ABU5DKP9_9BURK|nr:response regulator [Paucibacter sp. R3-3]MDY0746878.1 response regulator [Paucibacter sp. R3-3]
MTAVKSAPTACALVSIVDDDPFVLTAASSLVRSFGWHAKAFASAQDFLAADVAGSTDCLICDIGLDDLDGIALLARMQGEGLSVPTVFITALASHGVRERAMRQGALCVIEKPIDAGELESWVQRALAEARAQ